MNNFQSKIILGRLPAFDAVKGFYGKDLIEFHTILNKLFIDGINFTDDGNSAIKNEQLNLLTELIYNEREHFMRNLGIEKEIKDDNYLNLFNNALSTAFYNYTIGTDTTIGILKIIQLFFPPNDSTSLWPPIDINYQDYNQQVEENTNQIEVDDGYGGKETMSIKSLNEKYSSRRLIEDANKIKENISNKINNTINKFNRDLRDETLNNYAYTSLNLFLKEYCNNNEILEQKQNYLKLIFTIKIYILFLLQIQLKEQQLKAKSYWDMKLTLSIENFDNAYLKEKLIKEQKDLDNAQGIKKKLTWTEYIFGLGEVTDAVFQNVNKKLVNPQSQILRKIRINKSFNIFHNNVIKQIYDYYFNFVMNDTFFNDILCSSVIKSLKLLTLLNDCSDYNIPNQNFSKSGPINEDQDPSELFINLQEAYEEFRAIRNPDSKESKLGNDSFVRKVYKCSNQNNNDITGCLGKEGTSLFTEQLLDSGMKLLELIPGFTTVKEIAVDIADVGSELADVTGNPINMFSDILGIANYEDEVIINNINKVLSDDVFILKLIIYYYEGLPKLRSTSITRGQGSYIRQFIQDTSRNFREESINKEKNTPASLATTRSPAPSGAARHHYIDPSKYVPGKYRCIVPHAEALQNSGRPMWRGKGKPPPPPSNPTVKGVSYTTGDIVVVHEIAKGNTYARGRTDEGWVTLINDGTEYFRPVPPADDDDEEEDQFAYSGGGNFKYNYIKNPINNKNISIKSQEGINILNKYLNINN